MLIEVFADFRKLGLWGLCSIVRLAGIFSRTLHIQDHPTTHSCLQLKLTFRDHTYFMRVGVKSFFKNQGIYYGLWVRGLSSWVAFFSGLWNLSVGPSASAIVGNIMLVRDPNCNRWNLPKTILMSWRFHAKHLISLTDMNFYWTKWTRYCCKREETVRTLGLNCEDLKTWILNSGYADFQASLWPEGIGHKLGF